MKIAKLVVAGVALLSVTVALAAAPASKRPASTRVAPPTATTASGSDALNTASQAPVIPESDNEQPTVSPDAQLVAPPVDRFETPSPTPSGVASAPINMNWYSINNGGATEVAAGNIKMGLSIGQNAVGEVSAGNIKMGLGFWYGANSSTPTCACDCHADPQCDGVTNIFDVTLAINVAFRGAAAITDPNGLCPLQTTDVDCNGVTNIFDVTHMVNVAFRGGNPATEFCNACAQNL